jgi:hypothetical protein
VAEPGGCRHDPFESFMNLQSVHVFRLRHLTSGCQY